jgi:hypothetical protein
MGVRNWLFGERELTGRTSSIAAAKAGNTRVRYRDSFVEINAQNFFGPYNKSPNERYTIAWSDATNDGAHGGARTSGLGRYLLLESDTILVTGRMERPNDGRVANNGTFILNDWGFDSGLSGTFGAFTVDGQKIVSRNFKANLYNNGLSSSGRWAVCQTCNSPDEHDSSLLTVFDLAEGNVISSWQPTSGWASSYEFDEERKEISLNYPKLGIFRYAFDGDFIDRDGWQEASLTKGDFGATILMAERLLREAEGNISDALAHRLIASVERVFPSITDPKWLAHAHRLRGTCFEALGMLKIALDCYEKALALDPKIGLKRRTAQIRKSLSVDK